MVFSLLGRAGHGPGSCRSPSAVWKKVHRTYKSHPRVFKLIVAGLLVLYFWGGSDEEEIPYRASTTGKDQWINVEPNYLAAGELEQLVAASRIPERLKVLDREVYSGLARGWVVKFSADQWRLFEDDPLFTGCVSFFKKVASSSTTDFVVRLVVSSSDPMQKTIIERHRDEIYRQQRFTPHTISLLYVESPEDMIGGELTVWPGLMALSEVRSIPTVILPSANILSVLRGDSDYKLNSFKSYLGGNLSVAIIEQYQIPLTRPKNLPYYCHEESCA